MKMMTFKTALGLTLASTFYSAYSQASNYVPDAGSSIKFAIKYTLGTHEGSVTAFKGLVDIEPNAMIVRSGQITFAVNTMKSGNSNRDCHITEAIGLNYATSDYPASHVCDSKAGDILPTTGKNASSFPTVTLNVVSATLKANAGTLKATFNMHGVSKTMDIPVTVTKEDNKIRVVSNFSIMLPDYEIIVKPVGPIKVKDEAKISVNLLLKPQD